jgi:hypothetical protein
MESKMKHTEKPVTVSQSHQHINAAAKEFDAHICADHPPLKNIEKPSTFK